jgi:hypothetical protein
MERVGITVERLMELFEKEAKLDLLKKYVTKVDAKYGLTSEATKTVDLLLDIKREEE